MFRRSLALLFVVGACLCAHGQIDIGTSRDEVLRLFGKPTSVAQRGERELLLYPKGCRIELTAGKVSDIRGPLPPVVVETPPAPAAEPVTAAPASDAKSTPDTASPGTPSAQALVAPPPSAAPPAAAPKGPTPLERLSQEIEKMEKGAPNEREEHEHHGGAFNVVELLVSLVLHFGITIFALRVAFKYWEMDAFWKGTLAIAGIDLAVYAALELLGPVTSGISTSGGVQGGIGMLVMVFTVQRFCFNKRLQNAILTALAVKVIVQLCHIFLFVFLLNAMFG